MRNDGIASLKEALAQAGLDHRPNYVPPRIMAERFRHRPQPRLTEYLNAYERSGIGWMGILWPKMRFLVVLVLMSALLAGVFALGKKSGAAALAPCYVEALAELVSL